MATYLLAILVSHGSPNSKDLEKILDSMGIETNEEHLKKVISEVSIKNIEDGILQRSSKLTSMPSGGAITVPASVGSAAPVAAGSAPAAVEEKKEE
ncbi:60S acidic ribosomal protein P2-like [Dromiciops gliroides]|uniref:60S acidic ribosomal protein P2-like n=1 Tax=Dromiciops gliroides TaxID=33562 RepID=UPI001CC68471|nr:60S acidic ribosomal protein P2-like [Dromiciops gliroides]